MFRLIIVEDESRLRRHLKNKFTAADSDFKVVGAYENGEDALLEIDLVQPHVVITDLIMPRMNGLALIKQIKELYPEIICAILSGHQDFEYTREAIKLQVNDYLLKPPSTEQIQTFLASLKNQLQHNRTVMEVELIRSWTYYPPKESDTAPHKQTHVLDYFFHAKHILLFILGTADMDAEWIAQLRYRMQELFLRQGEKLVETPTPHSNEYVFFLGLYECDDRRMEQLLSIAEAAAKSFPYAFVAASAANPEKELHPLLQKTRKTAQLLQRMDSPVSLYLDQTEPSLPPLPPPSPLSSETIAKLKQAADRGNKESFYNLITLLLQISEIRQATRKQWSKIISSLFLSLAGSGQDSNALQVTQEHQIEDALLQINDYHEAIEFVKHMSIYVLFDENDDHATDWVHAVDRYIRSHYRDNFTLGQLAEQFDLNPAYLSRVFKKMKSVSPLDLLLELKIEEAKRLIQTNPRALFKDVALQLGYEDAFHFSKLFKKWTGITPTEYKNGVIHASNSLEQTQS